MIGLFSATDEDGQLLLQSEQDEIYKREGSYNDNPSFSRKRNLTLEGDEIFDFEQKVSYQFVSIGIQFCRWLEKSFTINILIWMIQTGVISINDWLI